MSQVNTLVITGYGTNSHQETAHAARLAGADRADVVHFSDIVAAKVRLSEYQFLVFPGGFLDGDDLGAAQAAAQRWLHLSDAEGQPLLDSLNRFVDAGGLVLGICNGFQLLVKLGVLPALDGKRFERQVPSAITTPPAMRTDGSSSSRTPTARVFSPKDWLSTVCCRCLSVMAKASSWPAMPRPCSGCRTKT